MFFNTKFIDLKSNLRKYINFSQATTKGNTIIKKIYNNDYNSNVVEKLSDIYNIERVNLENFKNEILSFKFEKVDFQSIDQEYFYLLKDNSHSQFIAFIVDPSDYDLISGIREKFGLNIRWIILNKKELSDVKDYVKKNIGSKSKKSKSTNLEFIPDIEKLNDTDDPTVKLVDKIINEGLERKSSDIHIEAFDKDVIIKYRIDGVLYEYERIEKSRQEFIISRLKIMSELDITEKRIPQDGRFSKKYKGLQMNFRISILPTIFGETAVIRILSSYQFEAAIEELGMKDYDILTLKNALNKIGMILVSGPTGSGKTTTLYSALKALVKKGYKIITIEDPVEYDVEGVVQIPVNNKVGLTFSEGLRSIVRQDPDVIMVGEIRDSETAKIAVNSALTGHLVLSTVHANNSFETFARLNNLGCDNFQLASAIEIIISQRLVRKLCNHCKKEVKISRDYITEFVNLFGQAPDFETVYSNVGCSKCYFTGFSGRTGIFEILNLDDKAALKFNDAKNFTELNEVFNLLHFVDLKSKGLRLIKDGISTLKEINRGI